VPLPEDFVSYLLEDGLFLPEESDAMPRRTQVRVPQLEAEGYSEWEEEEDEEEVNPKPPVPTFPDLAAEVQTAIEKLGGDVIPKLNWSAPKDTAWIATTGDFVTLNPTRFVLFLSGRKCFQLGFRSFDSNYLDHYVNSIIQMGSNLTSLESVKDSAIEHTVFSVLCFFSNYIFFRGVHVFCFLICVEQKICVTSPWLANLRPQEA